MRKELLWQKLANKLAHRIATGRYPLGSLLPTELMLVETEKVSRNTVRAALQELKARGLIERQAHNGTRVISTGGARNFHQKLSSLRDLDDFGHNYGRRVTDIDFVTADRRLAEAINCAVGATFLRFVNTRTSNDPEDPAVVCTKVFINAAYGEIVTQARQHPETLNHHLHRRAFSQALLASQAVHSGCCATRRHCQNSRRNRRRTGLAHPSPLS